jgi:hypothetical protein
MNLLLVLQHKKVESNPVITTSVYATLVYNVRYSAVPINFSLLTTTLYSLLITTLVYNDKKYSVPFMTL